MDDNRTTNSINIIRWQLFVCIAFSSAAMVYGCQLMGDREIDSPLSYSVQREKIIEIAPKGTSRENAVANLKEAGIAGEFARGDNIYYCGSWRQKNGIVWRTNVALLFDEEGKVIGTRPIEAGVGYGSRTSSTKKQQAPREKQHQQSDRQTRRRTLHEVVNVVRLMSEFSIAQ